jgi:hypothetical protein
MKRSALVIVTALALPLTLSAQTSAPPHVHFRSQYLWVKAPVFSLNNGTLLGLAYDKLLTCKLGLHASLESGTVNERLKGSWLEGGAYWKLPEKEQIFVIGTDLGLFIGNRNVQRAIGTGKDSDDDDKDLDESRNQSTVSKKWQPTSHLYLAPRIELNIPFKNKRGVGGWHAGAELSYHAEPVLGGWRLAITLGHRIGHPRR